MLIFHSAQGKNRTTIESRIEIGPTVEKEAQDLSSWYSITVERSRRAEKFLTLIDVETVTYVM